MVGICFRLCRVFGALLLVGAPAAARQALPQAGDWRVSLPRADQTDQGAAARPAPVNADVPVLMRNEPAREAEQPIETAQPTAARIGSVLIESAATIDHAMFERAIEPFLGVQATREELAKLAQQIADIARANGMLLASTSVPAQQIDMGIVRIAFDPGSIDEVRIVGSDNRALRALFAPLVGSAVMQGELERRLMLANNIPQISVKQTELLIEAGKRILVVTVQRRKRTSGQVLLDNFGSENVGPWRLRLSMDTLALLDDSDRLNLAVRTNPLDPRELLGGSLGYSIGLNNNGTRAEIAAALSESAIDSRSGLATRDVSSRFASLSVSHPLHRSRNANLWIDGQIEYLSVEIESLGALLQSDTVVTVSVGMSSSVRVGQGWLRAGGQVRQGLGLLGATGFGDPFSSRGDADGQFTAARGWVNWSGKLSGAVTLRLAVSGQLASEPLLALEEMGIGGAFAGRAFDFFERSGDQGILGLAELGYEFSQPARWLKRLQPYAFVDGGVVGNLRGGFGGGTLVSAGAGLRADVGRIGLQIETAVPVYVSNQPAVSNDPAINFQMGFDL